MTATPDPKLRPVKPAEPVAVALVVLPGDLEHARKLLRFIPKGALLAFEGVQLADMMHPDQRELVARTLTLAVGRAIDTGAGPSAPVAE
mgnify:FL=1